ncbi:MAG: tetratricopeptide repeat protein [Planctomycetota bacterium]|jgi:tetratricopeptide (TPR) repeat protein
MKKLFLLSFVILFSSNVIAEQIAIEHSIMRSYDTKHFAIHSDLHPAYMDFIKNTAETFYANMYNVYFKDGWAEPGIDPSSELFAKQLIIYYSDTEDKTEKLLVSRGHKEEAGGSYYVPSVPAIYAYRISKSGEDSGWAPLLQGITQHFVGINLQHMPEWFQKETGHFFSKQSRIIKDKLFFEKPDSKPQEMLKAQQAKINIKRLYVSAADVYYKGDIGDKFARAFFNWLYEIEQLTRYIRNVQRMKFPRNAKEFDCLSKSTGKTLPQINAEISEFIEETSQPSNLDKGLKSSDNAEKKGIFLNILQLQPQHRQARLNLAECYSEEKNYKISREHLEQLLDNKESLEYYPAMKLTALTYYKEKNYSKALECFSRAWECSNCCEYRYKLAYYTANCHLRLKNTENTVKWYQQFLNERWNPEDMKECADYAQKYINEHGR